jgi:hypothetical protein
MALPVDMPEAAASRWNAACTSGVTGTVTRIGFCSGNNFSCVVGAWGVFIRIMLHHLASLCQHGAQLAPRQIEGRAPRESFKGVLRP